MPGTCIHCDDGDLEVGVLCARCARPLGACAGLLPDHVVSAVDPAVAQAWLVDPWGMPHAIIDGAIVGRRPGVGVNVLTGSVSREHAQLRRDGERWQVRDLGSRNGTQLDGAAVRGRADLRDGAHLSFGEARFLFKDGATDMPALDARSHETAQAGATGRFAITSEALELVLLGVSAGEVTGASAGALLYREPGGESWSEATLSPLEFALLELLCTEACRQNASPTPSRACVPTREIAHRLPFQSRYANEENVRQVVRRLRRTLGQLGATGVLESIPTRGYYLAWTVTRGSPMP